MTGIFMSVAITNIALCAMISFGIYWSNTCWPLWGLLFIQRVEYETKDEKQE